MESKITHFLYTPFTGLGLYNGFRGQRWLRNRIKIFKQFVIPSLQNQINQNFILWISWRREERHNPLVKELKEYLDKSDLKSVFTYSGVCFYDDKYEDSQAKLRLVNAVHGALGDLINYVGECESVLMTIQPSDDCYEKRAVESIQRVFQQNDVQATGYTKGYICNYLTKEVAEYNPNTNPPFYTIKFPRDIFCEPRKHCEYTALKHDVGKYKKGTPLPSHEYVGDCFKYGLMDVRGFLVGCHTENISTYYNHPFKGADLPQDVLKDFGLYEVPVLRLKWSLRKLILRKLPFKLQRKLRYWWGEKIYNFLRS